MSDVFELRDPDNAQAFLTRFSGEVRRRGEACFRGGRVQEVASDEPGVAYRTVVQDGVPRQVSLRYNAVDGWWGRCSCAGQFECEHIYAGMCALLAEHRNLVVQGLSARVRWAAFHSPSRPAAPVAEDATDLMGRLEAALGRRLTRQEQKFVKQVQYTYLACRPSRRISGWDFSAMGLPLQQGVDWNLLEIWPAFPATLHEFWLYVANAALEHSVSIPDFMEPVTDLGAVKARLAAWRRGRQIQKWKRFLADYLPALAATAAASTAADEVDLRLVIGPGAARLQWRRSGAESFVEPRQTHLNRAARAYERGELQLAPGADLLWQFLSDGPFTSPTTELDYEGGYNGSDPGILRRILRSALLESRVVNREGRPLARSAEPLRWEMLPAASDEDDYRLRLVAPDGAPLEGICSIIEGHPTLYLTANAVFKGPLLAGGHLDTKGESRIPAPVIESAEGVAFLQALRIELPPRVRARVRSLPLEIAIHCQLEHPDQARRTEECALHIQAQAPDGHAEYFDGARWVECTAPGALKRNGPATAITVYDRSALESLPPLLEPLNLKFQAFNSRLALRVTRKFPEQFAAWLKSLPPGAAVQLEGELASFASTEVAGRVRLHVEETEIDWFNLRVVLDVSDTTLTAEEIKLLLNARGRFVRLEGKGWRRLQFDLSQEEDERLASLGLNPRELSAEPQRLHALQLADEAARKFLPEQQVEQIQRRASELKARVTPALPPGLTAQLRPYQVEGFHFLAYLTANRFGGILADDMGLGKTLQALAWLVWARDQADPGLRPSGGAAAQERADAAAPQDGPAPASLPSLVVCPKSVMDNWHAEAARFTPGLRVKLWPAAELDCLSARLAEADLHVINYSQLRLLGETLAPIPWYALILDEGQYIKNPDSQTAQVACALRARYRLVLSGTPIENRLLDLWSLMAFAMPGLLGNRAQFARLYDAKDDPFARRRLAARVRPFLLRRTKAQVAKDLPDRIEEDLYCEIEGEQQTLYRAELKRAQQLLLAVKTQRELAEHQFNLLASLLRLRQICCHPRLISPASSATSAKTEALLEQLEPLVAEGHKVLVFSQFVTLLDLLQPVIEERGWPVFYLAGDTENRGQLVRDFQAAQGPAIFLISLKAGGFGLNLTAASYVVLFDPWWNPAVENQAIDRTHRIGQTSNVIAYRLLIKDSIEEKIRQLQKRKKALAEEILGEERFAQGLTLDDLQFLFAG